MTGAEAIAKCLINEKVEYVFGYPGVAIAPLFDSLYGTQKFIYGKLKNVYLNRLSNH